MPGTLQMCSGAFCYGRRLQRHSARGKKRKQFRKRIQLPDSPVKVHSPSFFQGKNGMKRWTFKLTCRMIRTCEAATVTCSKSAQTNSARNCLRSLWKWQMHDSPRPGGWNALNTLGKGDWSIQTKLLADPTEGPFGECDGLDR